MVTIDGAPYCCWMCRWWRGRLGAWGECTIPATPATVNCGPTNYDDLCEQWDTCDNRDRRKQLLYELIERNKIE